jgi:hypothetical protein
LRCGGLATNGMVKRRNVREIGVLGRNTQGVRVMCLKEGAETASPVR